MFLGIYIFAKKARVLLAITHISAGPSFISAVGTVRAGTAVTITTFAGAAIGAASLLEASVVNNLGDSLTVVDRVTSQSSIARD